MGKSKRTTEITAVIVALLFLERLGRGLGGGGGPCCDEQLSSLLFNRQATSFSKFCC